ncbi:DUF4384 domain-containing protein [Azospirillum lipoferum]|nr:DUF4384 domain-containing protein [Azospirillum lipoferum]
MKDEPKKSNRMACRIALGSVLAVSACALPNPEHATIIAQPATQPTRTITGFTDGLRCMDRKLGEHGIRHVVVTSTLLPDRTGNVAVGGVDMLISALSTMSESSQAFLYVSRTRPGATEAAGTDWVTYEAKPVIERAEYVIGGSISQADTNIAAGRRGFDISQELFQLGAAADRRIGSIAVDLHVALMDGQTVIPGVTSNNTAVIASEGKSGEAGARILKAGVRFNLSVDKQETIGQAARTLIELGSIELVGKLFKLPYWDCLQIDNGNKLVQEQLRAWYDGVSETERLQYIRQSLEQRGYLTGGGANDPDALRATLARFQADNNLVASGRPTFETFMKLSQGANALPLPGGGFGPGASSQMLAATRPARELTVNVRSTGALAAAGPAAKVGADFKTGDRTAFIVTLSRSAHLRCFYTDSAGATVRLYPNRFQTASFVSSGTALTIPPVRGDDVGFDIKLRRPGIEEVACFANERGFDDGHAAILAHQDLMPIPGVTSVDAIAASIGAAGAGPIASDKLSYTVH